MHNIYIDGSYDHSNKLIGIGIYNSTTKFELAMVKDGKNVSEAEYEALEECLRYCKLNGITEQSRIFTDSKEIHNAYHEYVKREGISEFIWIPRELNKKADALSSEYKQYTKSTRTKISFDNKCVIKTTKIKEIQETKTLNKEQIIDILNEFSLEKRMALIEKLKNDSGLRKTIYEYYFGNKPNLAKSKRNTYYYLIPLIIENTKNKSLRHNLLNEITTDGINHLLKNIKMKETI